MPVSEHENSVWVVQKFVNDAVGTVNDLADSRIAQFWNHATDLGKVANGKRVIDELIAETPCRHRVITSDESDDLPQVILALVGENYWPTHASTSFRASSAGMPSRRCA